MSRRASDPTNEPRDTGLTLIELSVATALFALMGLLVVSMFSSVATGTRTIETKVGATNTARTAMEAIARAVPNVKSEEAQPQAHLTVCQPLVLEVTNDFRGRNTRIRFSVDAQGRLVESRQTTGGTGPSSSQRVLATGVVNSPADPLFRGNGSPCRSVDVSLTLRDRGSTAAPTPKNTTTLRQSFYVTREAVS